MVGLQAAQARVARGADVTRREAAVVRPLRHRSVHLGGEHDLLASVTALREPVADDRLRRARALVAAVPVGGVEEVDAVIERLVHDHERVALRRERSEVHGAETQLADAQRRTSESPVLHAVRPPARVRSIVRPALATGSVGDRDHRAGRRVVAVLLGTSPATRQRRARVFVIRPVAAASSTRAGPSTRTHQSVAPVVGVVVHEQRDRRFGPGCSRGAGARASTWAWRRPPSRWRRRRARSSRAPDVDRPSGRTVASRATRAATEPGAHLCRIHAAHSTAGRTATSAVAGRPVSERPRTARSSAG